MTCFCFKGICYFNGNEKFYSQFLMPFVHRTIDAESAHRLAIKVAKYGLVPKFSNDQANFPVLVLVYCLLFKL